MCLLHLLLRDELSLYLVYSALNSFTVSVFSHGEADCSKVWLGLEESVPLLGSRVSLSPASRTEGSSYFSHCYDTISGKSNLKIGYSGTQFKGTVHPGGEGMGQAPEGAAHITPQSGNREIHASVVFAFPIHSA